MMTSKKSDCVSMEMVSIYDLSPQNRKNKQDKPDPAVQIQQDVCRHVINTEIMMLYGHDVSGYLPPLPQQDRPRSSLTTAWDCDNQAVRQLGNVTRRGPRNRSLRGSNPVTKSTSVIDKPRPHTAYCSHVRGVLNTKPSDIRPHTAGPLLDRTNDKKRQPVKDPKGLVVPKRLEDLQDDPVLEGVEGVSEAPSTLPLAGGGLRKPKWGMSKRKKGQGLKKHVLNMDHLNDDISRVLKGDLDNLPDPPPTAVKIYLCTHPHDMVSEKAALEREAYPQLREYCQGLGLEFQLIDTHLKDSGCNPEDIRFHARQLDRCQHHSIGPNCVVLLGDLYGPASIPLSLNVKDYQFLHKAASISIIVEPTLLEDCYKLENNTIPPTYVLQNPDQMSHSRCTELRHVLKHSVFTASQIGKFRPEREREFGTSGLEMLVQEAVIKSAGQQSALKCLCFHRKFVGIDEDLGNEQIADYIDINFSDGKVLIDKTKQERLDGLASSMHSQLGDSNMKGYEVSWHGEGIQPNRCEEHDIYLKQFVQDFVEGTKRLIDLNHSMWQIRNPNLSLYKEVLQHSKVCADSAGWYSERQQVTQQLETALQNNSQNSSPLVLLGEHGTGKTSILSHIVKKGGKLLKKHTWVAVYHQIGLTQNSTNIREMLTTLCHQLSINYNIDPPTESDSKSINRISQTFSNMLETISKHHADKKPLFVLLDDVHEVPDTDRANTFFWLPRKCPKNIFVILSTTSQSEETTSRLTERIPSSNFLTVPVMTSTEGCLFIHTYLQENARKINDEQKEILQSALERGAPPILLKLYVFDILKWGNNDIVTNVLHKTLRDHLEATFKAFEEKYGPHLVRTVATLMSILRWGISEVELEDALLSHSSVVVESMNNTDRTPSIYTAIKCKLYRLLDHLLSLEFLVETCSQGRTLFSWKTDLLNDTISSMYFGVKSFTQVKSEVLLEFHQRLQTLFSQETGVWLQNRELYRSIGICFITPQLLLPSNTRKLKLLPHLLTQCETIDGEESLAYIKRKCLCEFQWLLNKLQGTSIEDTLADFKLFNGHDLEVDLVRDFMTMCGFGLQQNPSGLSLQLLGTMPYMNASRYPLVAEMIEAARAWMMDQKFPLLVPAFQCFPSPLDMCKAKLWGITDILLITENTNLAVVKSKDNSLEVWDMINKEWVYQLGVKFDKVTKNVFCNTNMVLAINAPHTLEVWQIESGFQVFQLKLEDIFGEKISSMACQAHNDTFDKVAFTISDDEFNQSLVVLDTSSGKIVMRNDKFDLKDEFFPGAAAFLTIHKKTWLVIAYARSEVVDDDKYMDFVKLHMYNVTELKHIHSIACGSKKFHSLLTFEDRCAIISWKNSSFDIYSIEQGTHLRHLTHPDVDLIIQASSITSDGYLVALASSSTNKEDLQMKMYHGLWVWNIEEGSHSELFTNNHSSTEDIPKQFIIIEELHLAVIGIPELAQIQVWDLPTSTRIHTADVHTEGLDHMLKSPDPYKIFTCSSTEKVVKLWDLYNLVTCTKEVISADDSKHNLRAEVYDEIIRRSTSTLSARSDGIKTPESILKNPETRTKTETSLRPKSVRFADTKTEVLSGTEQSTFAICSEVMDMTKDITLAESYNQSYSSENIESANEGNSIATSTGLSAAEEVNDIETTTYGSAGQVTMHSQLENMFHVTMARFTQDNEYVVTTSNKGLPTIWDVKTGFPSLYLEKGGQDDVATPWFSLACKDKYIVGTTFNNRPCKEGWPQLYKFQVWLRETGRMHKAVQEQKDIFVTKCVILNDDERALVTVLDHYRPGAKAEVQLQILNIENLEPLHKVRVYLPQLPSEIQVTGDSMYTILVSPAERGKAKNITVYNLEDGSRGESPPPGTYEFREGDKFNRYGATSNIILRNGISLASGFNGDLQLWDINSGEYEGNLYDDPSTKEKANPSLHNHKGKQINHMALSEDGRYLICGGGDGTTSMWDMDSEVMTHSYGGHKGEVCKVAISSDNQIVLTAGADCMLYVWPFAGDRPLCLLYIHVIPTELQVSEDKQTICVIGHRQNEPSRFMMFRLINLNK